MPAKRRQTKRRKVCRTPDDPQYKTGGATGKGWKPGESGNPSGAKKGIPKRKSIVKAMQTILSEQDGTETEFVSAMQKGLKSADAATAFAWRWISLAWKGDYKFFRDMLQANGERMAAPIDINVTNRDIAAQMLGDPETAKLAEELAARFDQEAFGPYDDEPTARPGKLNGQAAGNRN